jgi:hypothetical protein
MSVELYPNIADLDEKLSALEDAELSQRILSANPDLFGSAAAREEVSVFAAAWKRFGALALAVTTALAIGAGYVFMPHAAVRPAVEPAVVPVTVHTTAARASQKRPSAVAPHAVPAAARAAAPLAAPAHHAAAYHHPAAASNVAAPAAHAAAVPSAASGAGAQAEAPIQYESSAQVVSSAGAPPTNPVPPDGTKTGTLSLHGDAPMPVMISDSCTPQGGRLAAITQR